MFVFPLVAKFLPCVNMQDFYLFIFSQGVVVARVHDNASAVRRGAGENKKPK